VVACQSSSVFTSRASSASSDRRLAQDDPPRLEAIDVQHRAQPAHHLTEHRLAVGDALVEVGRARPPLGARRLGQVLEVRLQAPIELCRSWTKLPTQRRRSWMAEPWLRCFFSWRR
jgi:hypothetical protein